MITYVEIQLTEAQFDRLMKPVVGTGGFQSFLREIHKRAMPEWRTVGLQERYIRQLKRYAAKGDGGFQLRIRPLLRALRIEP